MNLQGPHSGCFLQTVIYFRLDEEVGIIRCAENPAVKKSAMSCSTARGTENVTEM